MLSDVTADWTEVIEVKARHRPTARGTSVEVIWGFMGVICVSVTVRIGKDYSGDVMLKIVRYYGEKNK